MRIAVNTRFLFNEYLEGLGYYIHELFRRIVTDHPEHEFIFIFDRPYDSRFIYAKNVTGVVARPAARHPLLWKLWYDVKLPAILKKYKADVFVSCDNFCSLSTTVPQCIVVHDLAFLHFPKYIPQAHYLFYNYYTPKYLRKAARIVTVSQFSKEDIIKQYGTPADKISIVPNAAKSFFRPLEVDEKQQAKEKYANGNEYFVYAGSIHPRKNIINLLKAFSIFKKRQQSNWKLVLAGRMAWKNKEFQASLDTYKYRKDVVLTGYLAEEVALAIGGAYALVYPSVWEGFGVPVVEAMEAGIPVITSEKSSMQEIAKDAALYADPYEPASIAETMMTLYKDEDLRHRLIEKGSEIVKGYNWDHSAKLLWEEIKLTAMAKLQQA